MLVSGTRPGRTRPRARPGAPRSVPVLGRVADGVRASGIPPPVSRGHRRTRHRTRARSAASSGDATCEFMAWSFLVGRACHGSDVVSSERRVPDAPGRLRAMAATMRALRKTAREPGAELVEIAVPEPRRGRGAGPGARRLDLRHGPAHLRLERVGGQADPPVPMTFGHEVAGTVEAVGRRGASPASRARSSPPRPTSRAASAPPAGPGAPTSARTCGSSGVDIDGRVRRVRRGPGAERLGRGRGDRSRRRLDHGALRQRGARRVRHGRRRGHRHERGRGDRVRADRHVRRRRSRGRSARGR